MILSTNASYYHESVVMPINFLTVLTLEKALFNYLSLDVNDFLGRTCIKKSLRTILLKNVIRLIAELNSRIRL